MAHLTVTAQSGTARPVLLAAVLPRVAPASPALAPAPGAKLVPLIPAVLPFLLAIQPSGVSFRAPAKAGETLSFSFLICNRSSYTHQASAFLILCLGRRAVVPGFSASVFVPRTPLQSSAKPRSSPTGDGGNGGSGSDADDKPFCGSSETQQECSAVRDGDGGISFVQEGGGPSSFV